MCGWNTGNTKSAEPLKTRATRLHAPDMEGHNRALDSCFKSVIFFYNSVVFTYYLMYPSVPVVFIMKFTIRASVDALCRDGPGQISRERVQRGRLTRQGTTS